MDADVISSGATQPTSMVSLRLVNYRMFEKVDIKLHSKLCVFLGDNGSGKTSILDAISLLISSIFPLCDYLPKIRALPYEIRNIRSHMESIRGKSRLVREDVSGVVGGFARYECTDAKKSYKVDALSVGRKLSQEKDLQIDSTIRQLASKYNESVIRGRGIPVFAHYGPHRGAEQGDRKRFARRKIDYSNPFSAYINALYPSLDFNSFLEWFSEEEASEFRMQRKQKDYKSTELEAVRAAIVKVFENSDYKVKDPRFEANPKRFVLTKVLSNGEELEQEFDQLSDGYRAMIALVADFARRLAIANQYSSLNPLDGEGILLIDEVDVHLHPKWQYRVLTDLQRTFPNVQLIVTTHSAEVVSSVPKESVYILGYKDDEYVTHPEDQTEGDDPDYIAGTIMQTPDKFRENPAYQAYLKCLAFVQQGVVETSEFSDLKTRVINHYGENHHITRMLESQLQGLENRRRLMAKLHKQ